MTSLGRRAALAAAACLALVGGACNAAASSSARNRGPGAPRSGAGGSQAGTPRHDSFAASVSSATGRYAHDSGQAHIYLHPQGSGRVRPVQVVFRGLRCSTGGRCLDLTGTLTGTLTALPRQVPDTGTAFTLAARGGLTALRAVAAHGSVHGTGFIMRGRETMTLTLHNSSGSVTLHALSPTVKGFSSP